MRTLPAMMLHLLNPFMAPFSKRVWPQFQLLLPGAFPQPWTGEPIRQYTRQKPEESRYADAPSSMRVTMTKRTHGSGRTVLTLDPFGSAKQKLAGNTTYQITIEGAGDTDGFAARSVAGKELARDEVSSFTTARK